MACIDRYSTILDQGITPVATMVAGVMAKGSCRSTPRQKKMKFRKLQYLLLSMTFAATALSPLARAGDICAVTPPVSNGCSTYYTEYVNGAVAVFREVFNSACDRHDVCYELLGKTRDACDAEFRNHAKDKCDSAINKWIFPGEWSACRGAAESFAAAVSTFGSNAYAESQAASAVKSQQVAQQVANDECGTTPERTKIYSDEMISYVNSSFAARLGRAPSIYEQFAAINANNPAADPQSWRASVDQYVESHRYLTPPSLTYSANSAMGHITLRAATSEGAGNHRWRLNSTDTYGPIYEKFVDVPTYNNINVPLAGFLTVVGSNGQKAMVVVEHRFVVRAECPRGIACY